MFDRELIVMLSERELERFRGQQHLTKMIREDGKWWLNKIYDIETLNSVKIKTNIIS